MTEEFLANSVTSYIEHYRWMAIETTTGGSNSLVEFMVGVTCIVVSCLPSLLLLRSCLFHPTVAIEQLLRRVLLRCKSACLRFVCCCYNYNSSPFTRQWVGESYHYFMCRQTQQHLPNVANFLQQRTCDRSCQALGVVFFYTLPICGLCFFFASKYSKSETF